MDTDQKVLFLLLGWLLGLLSPIIVDAIRRNREIREIRTTLETEIHELKYRLTCSAYLIKMHYGDVDRKFLEWVIPIFRNYKGLNPVKDVIDKVEKQLSLTDKEIAKLSQLNKTYPNLGYSLKKKQVPLLDTKIALLPSFSTRLQNQLLLLKTHLNTLNEVVEEAHYYLRLTLQSNISAEGRDRAIDNLNHCYKDYEKQAELIVNLINEIELEIHN